MDGYSVETFLARLGSAPLVTEYLAWIGAAFLISAVVAGYLPDDDPLGVQATRVCYSAIGLLLLSALLV